MNTDVNVLMQWVRVFREHMEHLQTRSSRVGIEHDYWNWREFPRNCCADAAELLALYLHEHCGLKPEYLEVTTEGQRDDGMTHAWVFCKGLYVDVTADQFPEVQAAVIVEANSHWHENFKGYKRLAYGCLIDRLDQNVEGGVTQNTMKRCYHSTLREIINPSCGVERFLLPHSQTHGDCVKIPG